MAFAEASPFPDPKDLLVDMFARVREGAMREISFPQALDEAVAEEMRRDERVITLGTDFTGDPDQGVRRRRACASRRSPRRC